MITAENLCKSFDGKTMVLDNLCCHIDKGTIYGLVGFNGSGKTTLLKIFSGIYTVDGGKVTIDGEPVFENESIKQRTIFVPDDLYFIPQATMKSMAKLYRSYYPRFDTILFKKLTNIFELNPTKRISGFSKGMQRQVALILAIASNPDYLFLDESFDGLDPVKRKMVKQLLVEAMADRDMTIVISSHNLRELDDLCDHIGSINNKKISFDCAVEDARATKVKCRVAFQSDTDEAVLDEINTSNIVKSGRIISFITTASKDEIDEKLGSKEPLLLEVIPMTLEEILISEGEVKSYDFTDLFK